VIGLPYPDARDPLLAARMRHADSLEEGAGKTLYQDICMRAVNQSIGPVEHGNAWRLASYLTALRSEHSPPQRLRCYNVAGHSIRQS